jgi:hypothetical protein
MSDEVYKSLFENSCSVMLVIHSETGRIIDANRAACNYSLFKARPDSPIRWLNR